MSDLIRRQDAIDAICKACSIEEDYHKCDGYPETSRWCDELVALRALPSAYPKQRWIPCKLLDHYYIKELKDCDNKSYLVTYKTKTGRRYVKKVNIYHGKIQSKVGGKVIAWMPLPDA